MAAAEDTERVDATMQSWRQGDVALEERSFVYVALGEEGVEAATSEVDGLVVLSQTCDIVRSSDQRPFVEVAPLVPADPEKLEAIERRKQPQFAFVPGVAKLGLVADLDRTMSVEKVVVARWTRTPGLSSRLEIRRFAEALERKRGRFAFPEDFHGFVRKLRSRILRKFGTNGDEGHGLDLLDEIRVRAAPSWNAAAVTLDFLFIRAPEDEGFPTADWPELLKGWMKLVPPGGRYGIVEGQVTTLDRLSAADYVGSERLDLDDVSPPREIAPSP